MNMSMNKKQGYMLVASLLIVVLLFAGLYFWLLYPVKTEFANKKNELANEEKLLEATNLSGMTASDSTFETTVDLQKEVPIKPMVDQLMLNLEKAEVVSNSFILNIAFAYDEVVVSDAELAAETDDDSTETTEVDVVEPLPLGVKKVTVDVSVESPSYLEMEAFLVSLHSMSRIIQLDSLTFNGMDELTSVDQSVKPVSYQLTFSAFYYPELSDIQDQLPSWEPDSPSNKLNPFNLSPDLTNQEDTARDDES